ncbi:MAG TPA: alpha/beta fold hydrolase [Gemmataceae bacterium]|jgi:polyhydroxybutyrate depolymerase|nr:alpha/beta fold hydrolase [Gemmataceae bacterium]
MSFPAPGSHRHRFHFGDFERSYLLHRPNVDGPTPLVIMLHGAGGNSLFAVEETGWSDLADRHGFTVVYPEGIAVRPEKKAKFLTNPQEWNDGSGRGRHDDVGFLLAVLDRLATIADPARVYLTGFSNGAGMAFRLAAEHADRFAALAPVAGHCWIESPRPSRPVPTFYLSGDRDKLVPLAGGPTPTPWGTVEVRPAVNDTLVRWGAAIGAAPGSALFPVRMIPGHGHHWPGGKAMLGEKLGGPAATAVDASREIWEFFSRFARQ